MVKKFLKIIINMGFLSIICLSIYHRMHPRFVIHDFICSFDQSFSQETQQEIRDYLNTCKHREQSLAATAQALEQFCEAIESVTISYLYPMTVSVGIKAKQPVLRVNNDLVWTEHKQLLAVDYYHPDVVALCPAVYLPAEQVADTEHTEQLLAYFVDRLSDELLNAYHVTIMNPYLVRIKEQENDWFSIHCSSSTIPREQTLIQCSMIKEELEISNKESIKHGKQWIADVRFRDQIIVRADRGI